MSKQTKKARIPAFGAAVSTDETPGITQPRGQVSSSASSTRVLKQSPVPSLVTLCMRKFAEQFVQMSDGLGGVAQVLQDLPDHLVPRIFSVLRDTCPTYLRHEVIVTYFFRGSTLTLSSDLLGANKNTILAIARINANLRELTLTDFVKIDDSVFASTLKRLIRLQVLNLRGCTRVSTATATAVGQSCPSLRVVNLNYTAVPPVALIPLLTNCPELQVLKLAGIPNWTDSTFAHLLPELDKGLELTNLTTLKLRQSSLSETSITKFVAMCPNLKRLDISFTVIRHAPPILFSPSAPSLEKLSLTSTSVNAAEIVAILAHTPGLKILHLGGLGATGSGRSSVSALTMSDADLRTITTALENCPEIEHINLAGSGKLGSSSKGDRALFDFILRVGRRCKTLNFSRVLDLRSRDLAPLVGEDDQPPPRIETLMLSNTGVDDDAAAFISACPDLDTLELAGTKVTKEGIFPILESCTRLQSLDLTSCRGIRVGERRRFFEVWQEEREA